MPRPFPRRAVNLWRRKVDRSRTILGRRALSLIRLGIRLRAAKAAATFATTGEVSVPDVAINNVVTRLWLNQGQKSAQFAAELIGVVYEPRPEAVIELRRIGRRRIRRIAANASTRRAVARSISVGETAGLTPQAIARGTGKQAKALRAAGKWLPVRDTVIETYKRRADTIVRTELALAHQHASHEEYKRLGVTVVEIFDGSDCGWRSHGDSDKANGSFRKLSDAERYPIAHPNCLRASAPTIPGSR